MKVEPPTSKQSSVTMEEIEDEDDIRMRSKARLSQSSPHIMEDDSDDDQVLLERMNYKKKNMASVPKTSAQTSKGLDHIEVPISTKLKFERPKAPEIEECSIPTLHSDSFKYKGPSQKEEVLLAVMDVNLNELKEGEEQLPDLHNKWVESAADILTGAPPHLPPFREVNHKIPLIDEQKWYNYHLPRCPDSLKKELTGKIQCYKDAGWCEETNVSQAAPMICVPKKSGKLHTIIDGRKQNENTEKDVTPFPDQEQIHMDVAQGKYRSKIDMSDVYALNHQTYGKQCFPQ